MRFRKARDGIAACDVVSKKPALARERVDGISILLERMPVDGAAVAADERKARSKKNEDTGPHLSSKGVPSDCVALSFHFEPVLTGGQALGRALRKLR